MRFGLVVFSVFCLLAFGVGAQDRPLYNSSHSRGVGSTLYNGPGTGGVKPLALNQILDGRNSSGYQYSYKGTGYNAYSLGASSSHQFSLDDIAAFRAKQAQRSAEIERNAMANVLGNQEKETQGYLNRFQGGRNSQATRPVKKRVLYNGRKRNIETPRRIFNSVR